MAHKAIQEFSIQFKSDGASASFSVSLTTGPVYFNVPDAGDILSPLFNTLPSGVESVACSNGVVSSATVALGVLTVNFSTVPAAGVQFITGTILY